MTKANNPLAAEGVDIVTRGAFDGDGLTVRNDTDPDGGDGAESSTMVGYFTRFNVWYRVDSWLEGTFMERVAPGAATKTIRQNRNGMVVAFDHGYDPQIGDKPLGPIEVLEERDLGVWYEVPLLDTDYNRNFVLPALAGRTIDGRNLGSVLGASFRMRVLADSWVMEPGPSADNPEGIPERTISELRCYEFGPVVYPASPEASAGVRSLTDHYFERSLQRHQRSAPPQIAPTTAPSIVEPNPATEPRTHSEPVTTRTAASLRLELATLHRK